MHAVHILLQTHPAGTLLKRILSIRQWAATLVIFAGLSAATLFGYVHTHADEQFESFVEEFFLQELASNPIHFHYSVDDAAAYHIDESQLTMSVYHPGDAANDVYALSLLSEQLDKFSRRHLSEQNRYLCNLLISYTDALSRTAAYPYFADPLSPASGVVSELPILLAEYRLDTVEDVEQYLSILQQIPDYLEGLTVYEHEKADAGLFMSDSTADKVIRQCTALMDSKQLANHTHFLEVTFANRLEVLVDNGLLTEEDSLSYRSLNERLLSTVVAPAYDRLADELTLLKGSGREICGLAHYAGGREYYGALLRLQTGSERDVAEIKQLLYDDLSANYAALYELMRSNAFLREMFASEPAFLPEMSPKETLDYLENVIRQNYPLIPSNGNSALIDYTVKYVDDSLEPYSAPAFYMTPPIDNIRNNTIYINALDTSDDLSLFTTLAHEGYPGHLYQTVYCQSYWTQSGVTPLRNVLYYGGYVEGWAMYAELSSYDYAINLAGNNYPEAASYYLACRLDRQIQLCLYSLLDIAIHYDGATPEDVQEILASFGSTDADTVAAIYAYIAEEPCNYPKYYLGYLEITELKKKAAEVWYRDNQTTAARISDIYNDPDFLLYFHRFLLENGPADFKTLSGLLSS